jgi:hypothetical protein
MEEKNKVRYNVTPPLQLPANYTYTLSDEELNLEGIG